MEIKTTLGGHRYAVGDALLDLSLSSDNLDDAWREITSSGHQDRFDRYSNPFEAKWTWRNKFKLPTATGSLMTRLEVFGMRAAKRLFVPVDERGIEQIVLLRDTTRHYASIFKYEPGDHLSVHVDAGIHPENKARKHITALLYLGKSLKGGALELWDGDRCSDPDPAVQVLAQEIEPKHGRFVLFENNDFAWHGSQLVEGDSTKVVVTVSFLSLAAFRFGNRRERAYFVPRPGEEWTEEMFALRDKRADSERFAEAYRV